MGSGVFELGSQKVEKAVSCGREQSMTLEPMVIRNHGYRGMEKLDQKLVPSTGHKLGQISSKKYFSTIFRTRILRSFIWKGPQAALSQNYFKYLNANLKRELKNIETRFRREMILDWSASTNVYTNRRAKDMGPRQSWF